MLPSSLVHPLKEQIAYVRKLHERDVTQGYGSVELAFMIALKYPNADKELGWQYIFPSSRLSADPRSGIIRRHHLDPNGLQRAVKSEAKLARFDKPVSPPPSATALPRISWKLGMTFARCRNYLDTKMSKRR